MQERKREDRNRERGEGGRGAVDWEKKECVRCEVSRKVCKISGRKECKKRDTNGKVIKEERRGGEGHGRLI